MKQVKKINFKGLGKQKSVSEETKESFSSKAKVAGRLYNNKLIGDTPFLELKKDKSYNIRIVPYIVDASHPLVQDGRLDAGDAAYVFDFNTHKVGADGTICLCPKTYGHKCPICDKAFALRNEGDEEGAKALRSSRRVLYNVVLANEPSKLYLLSLSHFLFEKPLLAELSKGDDEGNEYSIEDICVGATDGNGYSLKVMVNEVKKNGYTFCEYSMKIVKNKYDVDTDVLDDALPLHKLVMELPAKELLAIMEDDTVADEDDEEVYADGDDIPAYNRKASTPSKHAADDDEEDDSPTTEEDDEDDDEPVRKPAKKAPVEDAEEEEESQPSCPEGFEFGKDTNKYSECEDCPYYDACFAEKRRRRQAARG